MIIDPKKKWETPNEVFRTIIKEVPVIKEVRIPYEVIREVEVIRYIVNEVPIEVIKTVCYKRNSSYQRSF